jgi:hypothetical protein
VGCCEQGNERSDSVEIEFLSCLSDRNISKELFYSIKLVTYLSSRLRHRVVAGCLAERSETLHSDSC